MVCSNLTFHGVSEAGEGVVSSQSTSLFNCSTEFSGHISVSNSCYCDFEEK